MMTLPPSRGQIIRSVVHLLLHLLFYLLIVLLLSSLDGFSRPAPGNEGASEHGKFSSTETRQP